MLFQHKSFHVFLDLLSILLSYILAALARFGSIQGENAGRFGIWITLISCCLIYLLIRLFYQPKTAFLQRSSWNEFRVVFTYNYYLTLILAVILFFTKMGEDFSRIFVALFIIYNCLLMFLFRMLLKSVLLLYYQKPENRKRLLVITNPGNAGQVLTEVRASQLHRYLLQAVVLFYPELQKKPLTQIKDGLTYLHVDDFEEFSAFLRGKVIDAALINVPECQKAQLENLISKMEAMGITVFVTVNTFGISEKEKGIGRFGCYNVLTYTPRVFAEEELILKRVMDIAGSIVGMLITFAAGIFVVPAIWIESPGPVIFKQKRIGTNGRRFYIYKFRSMYPDAEARLKELEAKNEMKGGLMFKMEDDPRITKVGKFIRKTSIDELPQFFNVLKGNMSLVGTRPPTEKEFLQYEEWHKRRLSLKPGITGLWQVSGRSRITKFEDVVKLDLEYIDNWSVWMDIRILIQTVFVVLLQRGAK